MSVEKYYVRGERYDWIEDTRGLETRFHKGRAREILNVVNSEEFHLGRNFLESFLLGISVDLGCGTGLITRAVKGRVVAIDINRWNLDKTRNRVDADFIQADIAHIPIRDQIVDQVICTEVLEHVVNPKHVIKEVARILRPSGRFVGSVPSNNPIWKLRLALSTTHPHSEPFHHNYKKKELLSFFESFDASQNFDIVKTWLGNYFLNRFFYAHKK